MQVSEPDHVIVHTLTDCPHCQAKLAAETVTRHEKRQVFDIPPARIEVAEHQSEVKQCPDCGACVEGEFPANVSQPTQYGLRLEALACYLYSLQPTVHLSGAHQGVADCPLRGCAIREPVLLTAARQLASRTQASLEQVRQQLIAAPVVHFDESGMRAGGILPHFSSTPYVDCPAQQSEKLE